MASKSDSLDRPASIPLLRRLLARDALRLEEAPEHGKTAPARFAVHESWFAVIGAEKYFIPEGSGRAFEGAGFGELKAAPDGTPLLVALCDKDRQPIHVTDTSSGH